MDHQHIHGVHGANLSFSAEAYIQAEGFEPIPCHEAVSLIEKLIKQSCTSI